MVQGDDLADETVKAGQVLHVLATATTPILKPAPPKAVRVNEEEATLSVTVEDPNTAEKPNMHLKKIKWEFGDGTPQEVTPPAKLANRSELQIKHTFSSRCKAGKCKVTLTVEDTVAEGTPAKTTFEITVNESHAEELQHQKEAEEKVALEAKEAKEKQEAEEKAAKEAQEAKERQAAAEKAAKEAQEAKAAKEAKEKAEQKKREEEAHKASDPCAAARQSAQDVQERVQGQARQMRSDGTQEVRAQEQEAQEEEVIGLSSPM